MVSASHIPQVIIELFVDDVLCRSLERMNLTMTFVVHNLFCNGIAVVPIFILGFKWFAGKLAQMGLLPKFLQDLLQIHPQQQTSSDEKEASCCNGDSSKESTGPSRVQELESEEDFPKIVNASDKVVCKFTAS